MKRFMLVSFLAGLNVAAVSAQSPKYPPLSEYMMTQDEEVALARSAAPQKVSASATVKILTAGGYKVASQGENGFVCIVMRGWAAPTFTPTPFRDLVYDSKVRGPICFDPVASRTVLPYYELRTKLGMEGKNPEAIARGVAMAYALGELPKSEGVAFAYMWSAHQHLAPSVGAWRPHMMVFAPYYTNSMLGDNEFAGPAPIVTDDAGTPFAVVVIPVDGNAAVAPQNANSAIGKVK
jgi:hypothetical protein